MYDLLDQPVLPEDVVSQHGLWGFGQVVALALLMVPLATFFGQFVLISLYRNLLMCHMHLLTPKWVTGAFFGEQPQSVPLGNSSGSTSNSSASTSATRKTLYKNPWYKNLYTLWYFFSLAVGADLIYSFPSGGAGYYIVYKESLRWDALQYVFWSLYNLAILWVSTLVFLDRDLQRLWSSWKVGEYLSKEPIATIGWIFILVCLIGFSVMFDVFIEMQGFPNIPRIFVSGIGWWGDRR